MPARLSRDGETKIKFRQTAYTPAQHTMYIYSAQVDFTLPSFKTVDSISIPIELFNVNALMGELPHPC